MKTRQVLLALTICLFTSVTFAQKTIHNQSVSADIHTARDLFSKNQFISAGAIFEQVEKESDPESDVYAEAVYYQALCALKTDAKNGEIRMEKFLRDHPQSPYTNAANFELANAWFKDGRYPKVVAIYKELPRNGFSKQDQDRMNYQNGYSLFQIKRYAEAEKEFNKVRNGKSTYAPQATYYWGHIKYMNNDFDSALTAFNQLKDNPAFSPVIPFYMSQIYYKRGEYEKVIEFTEPLIVKADKQQVPELSKILGSSYFHLQQFDKAIPYLERYFETSKSRQRDENYLFAYCYYRTGNYEKAITPFEYATAGKDEMAQNAYYHLADCYVHTGDKNKARIAFEAASDMSFDRAIQEDALFNYAKITYELSYSPFNETINAFDKYIALYPSSERNDAAYNYLVQVYMSTNNFKDAIASIEKIQVKNQAIRKAYQRVTYYRGLELFKGLSYSEAIACFDKSLENGEFNPTLRATATFWKAEANYRLGNYEAAINGFERFGQMPAARTTDEYKSYNYNLGYAYFKLKDYAAASAAFNKFVQSAPEQDEKLADAYNRLGDCSYINRDFNSSQNAYANALTLNKYDADYALFQKAMSEGVQRHPEQKIASLKNLVQTYPTSAYVDDALYELGRTYERENQLPTAVSYYKNLLDEYPQSSYRPKALLQLGLISYNQSDYNQSMSYYKQITEKYPDSEESQAAMLGIKNNYIEQNNVDAYFAYAKRQGSNVQVTASEQDSLTYLAAERLVMSKDPKARQQLELYLQNYPQGSFSLNARFYLAEAKYADAEYSAALKDYELVLDRTDNIFTEAALGRAAELQFNAANYDQALIHYQRLEVSSGNKWNLLKARTGIMRCQYELGNFKASVDAAQKVLASENLSEVQKREADYKLAKSYLQTKQEKEAFPLLESLAEDTQSPEGAEAKYLKAEILFNQGKTKRSENEIMDFISKNTPHQYWLAKGFILLADIYLANGDQFQAKHTLMSMIENYPEENDGIIELAKSKLQHLEELEQQQQEQKPEPMQIDPNQN
ncbi:tetratricopeptide repeat protein [Mangrovibacterium diazotrophicum]|uniref:Tetratricopeptide repeat protein n=1 Tax=Mangrovibacterium diazotrophicum TaxID=1261403 RepID=A0A419VUI1_9BACT|nr:tetratricopeptide repeat protein [Mangrovibacterium diazotrophicum]RKD85178.1 tetratricopeptide repeat protein [Mangrovibacterium diazotrophicum]